MDNVKDNQELVDKLWDLEFIGFFPLGTIVLLVSPSIAAKELNYWFNITLTESKLLRILKEEDIHYFVSPDAWFEYKSPPKPKKRLEGVLVR